MIEIPTWICKNDPLFSVSYVLFSALFKERGRFVGQRSNWRIWRFFSRQKRSLIHLLGMVAHQTAILDIAKNTSRTRTVYFLLPGGLCQFMPGFASTKIVFLGNIFILPSSSISPLPFSQCFIFASKRLYIGLTISHTPGGKTLKYTSSCFSP